MYRVSSFVRKFARALFGGIAVATVWVNLNPSSYYDAIEFRLADLPLPALMGGGLTLTPLNLVSDALMALFLFFLGKELWEALVLERGALSGRAKAAMPIGAVAGGLLGAVLAWLIWSRVAGIAQDGVSFADGWTVPIGSDVVLCYVFGRLAFGEDHRALHLLLLITIAFDILGLLLTGLTHPAAGLHPVWLALPILAATATWFGFGRLARPGASERDHRRATLLWPYMTAGVVSWVGVALSGLPATLGLLPLIPAIPHADRSFGLFAEAEEFLSDPLNRITHLLVRPLPYVLFLFGLTRGGVDFAAYEATTQTVLVAQWVGKPVGILIGALVAGAFTGRLLPRDLRVSDLFLIALICGMGFTVPVLTTDAALPGGEFAEAARLGLAISLAAGPLALLLARLRRS